MPEDTEKLPVGVRRAFSKTLDKDIWVVDVSKVLRARGITCIGRQDFVMTTKELGIIKDLPDKMKDFIAKAKTVFYDADVISAEKTGMFDSYMDNIKKLPEKHEQISLC